MGGVGSGGPNGGSQYNPNNINGQGGDGQSGRQPMSNYTGMGYGGAKALADQQRGAKLQGKPTMPALAAMQPAQSSQQPSTSVIPFDAPSMNQDEDVMSGASSGPGPGFDPTSIPRNQQMQNDDFKNSIVAYAPVLKFVASRADASAETRATISLLLRDV